MKKLFTLLMLMVCAVGTLSAQKTLGRTLNLEVLDDYTMLSDDNVAISIDDGTGKTLTRKTVNYTTKKYTVNAKCYRDKNKDNVNLSSFDESCYAGFKAKISDGYKMNISGIMAKVAVSANFTYRIVIYNEAGNSIYTSGDYNITNYNKSNAGNVNVVISDINLKNIKGTVSVRMYYWNTGNSGSKYIVPIDLLLTGEIEQDKIVSSEIITNVTIDGVSISPNDLTTLTTNKTLTLDEPKYQAAPTVVFTKTKTFTDGTSKSVDETVTATEGTDYFTATTRIGEDTYTLNLARDKSVKSSDATLKSLSVNGEPVKDFNAETLSYSMEFPFGTTQIPAVTAEASSTVAKVDITQATELPGTATVVVTAEDGVTTSTYTINFTVSKGSSEKELTKAMFSNGFDGFIKDNIVEAYYMEGTEVPTLNATVSDKATYSVSGDVLTVTAEDGTTAEYTIKLEPVAPYTGLGRVFDGTENGWIKTGYSFDATNNKGWRFSKNINDSGWKRITDGSNRLYFFVDACNSITLTTAQGITSNRNIAVYVNNVKNSSISQAPKYNADGTAVITIPCDKNAPCMVAVVSNQTSGDGGFGEIVVDKDAPASITLNSYGYNTYSNANTVTVTGAVAYTCTVNNETKKVVLKELGTVVPAGQGVLLKGEANGTVSFAFGGEEPVIAQNDFQPVLKAVATPADKAIYVLNGNQFKKYTGATLVANKAYIELGAGTAATAMALGIEWDGGTTGIGGIEESVVDDNVPVYNLNGQRVDMNTKGIIIKNGKKIINK